ncbi:MAG TPA: hypothetical protein VK593_08865 [Edaphobacter sp.]|nr:hypothetical protein [Edaphobacter sp.]
MNRQKAISDGLLLGALFAGLNLLCILGIMHGHRVVHHTRVNFSHVAAHGPRRFGSRNDRSSTVATVDAVVEHAAMTLSSGSHVAKVQQGGSSVSPQVAIASAGLRLPSPEANLELLARENVLALGSAPRGPGLGRAPPVA